MTFATKPQIACTMIAAALDAGVPCAWVLGDALPLDEIVAAMRKDWALIALPWIVDTGFERWLLVRRS